MRYLSYYLKQGYCEKAKNVIDMDRVTEDWSDGWQLNESEFFDYVIKRFWGGEWRFSITLDKKQGIELKKRLGL